ncbi:nucleotide-binding universal stress UspA family protein [Winogradskyella pacifica]|uniref:Nucleotide-binding universal stress UspA family protein n=1 Tax=Winogradskyella pacifica TaxID=664642 RepID=A0A3D9LKE9_9FLAO|nr:universal stress protein [Winogradskyella pacifica]REE07735.1 nucleotide-binding universal stress UspA family protein [Winogradskyella pacifica]
MKHKILIPTDFSKNATKALRYAIELYKNDFCDFYLLNVFTAGGNIMEDLMNMEPGTELYETRKLDSENGLSKVYDMITMSDYDNPKHHFKTISVFNNPLEAIKDTVEKKDIEMIVMGTKGEISSIATAFGSTAIYVMEKVRNCPVIVVPLNAKSIMPKEIVFPTSYRTHYKRRELNYLIDIAKKTDATIIVLHISEGVELSKEQKENKKLLEEIFEGIKHKPHFLSHNSVESAVNIFIESRDSDMVAFINKKHTFFGSILTDPLVKSISFHTKVPILVMHDLRN